MRFVMRWLRCARIGTSRIMGFQHDWNKEVIAQFYATVYFGHDP
jgi:hypothetical protein